MIQVSRLFVYPVKSLGGVELTTSRVSDRGLEYDRRWMLVDKQNRFLTQREHPEMSLFSTGINAQGIEVVHRPSGEKQQISINTPAVAKEQVQIWDDSCEAEIISPEISEWFSQHLAFDCRLVHMPSETRRMVEPAYAKNEDITAFPDAFPFLLLSQASLDDLNSRLEEKVPVDRFRPNIVLSGTEPYQEDFMEHFRINSLDFYGRKLCARCTVITINQQNARKGVEPLKTLSGYRQRNNKVYFGQNLVHEGSGSISTGEEVHLLSE